MTSQLPMLETLASNSPPDPSRASSRQSAHRDTGFFAELQREALQADLASIEGEVTVLAKVARKIEKGRPETLGQPLPGVGLNREQRRKDASAMPLTVRLQYPAAVATVIGIYR